MSQTNLSERTSFLSPGDQVLHWSFEKHISQVQSCSITKWKKQVDKQRNQIQNALEGNGQSLGGTEGSTKKWLSVLEFM